MRYFISSAFHEWTEVDRITFENFKEKLKAYVGDAKSGEKLIKKYTKTTEAKEK